MPKNLAYERARNAIIPKAEAAADKAIFGKNFDSKETKDDAWNTAYHKEMDRLARYLCRLETVSDPCNVPYGKDPNNPETCLWRIEAPEFNNCSKVAWGKGPFTLEECGKMLGVTRERIRQIEDKALTKIKKTGARKRAKENLREFTVK